MRARILSARVDHLILKVSDRIIAWAPVRAAWLKVYDDNDLWSDDAAEYLAGIEEATATEIDAALASLAPTADALDDDIPF